MAKKTLKTIRYVRMRYFCDVVNCSKYDMDRLLAMPAFAAKLPAADSTGRYRVDFVVRWFDDCLSNGFCLLDDRPDINYQHYYGYR
jgi:hypothetical protein